MTNQIKPLAQKMTDEELQPAFEAYLQKLDYILETGGMFFGEKVRFKISRDGNNLPGVEANGHYTEDLTLGFLLFLDSVGIELVDPENAAGFLARKTGTLH
jgi:hypothetical protein